MVKINNYVNKGDTTFNEQNITNNITIPAETLERVRELEAKAKNNDPEAKQKLASLTKDLTREVLVKMGAHTLADLFLRG